MGLVGNWLGFMAYYNHSKGRNEKAIMYYRKATDKKMSNTNYLMAYGVLLMRTGSFQQAQDIFRSLLINATKSRIKNIAKTNIALTYWKLGDISTAVEMMEEVHNRFRNTKTYETLGYLLIESGDLEKALAFNLEALDYDDQDPVVLDNVGQNYYEMGEYEKALDYFIKAESIKPDQADTLYYLGCIYQSKGLAKEAKEKFQKALECNISALSTVSREVIEEKLRKWNG